MEKTLRLEWKRDPAGYRIEERKEGPRPPWIGFDLTPLEEAEEGLTPFEMYCRRNQVQRGGAFLVARSGRLESYFHDFDKTKLISLELANAYNLGASIRLPGEDFRFDFRCAVAPNLDALVEFATNWGLPNVHHEAHVGEFGPFFVPTLPPIRERIDSVSSDGSTVCVYRVASTLRGFCRHEFAHAFEGRFDLIGRCHYCGKLSARHLKRGDRKDEHEFCPNKGKCRHDFHNGGQEHAHVPRRSPEEWPWHYWKGQVPVGHDLDFQYKGG